MQTQAILEIAFQFWSTYIKVGSFDSSLLCAALCACQSSRNTVPVLPSAIAVCGFLVIERKRCSFKQQFSFMLEREIRSP